MHAVLGAGRTYFIRLRLMDSAGVNRDENVYWMSTTMDVLNWDASTWYNTPVRTFASLRDLKTMLPNKIDLVWQVTRVDINTTGVTIMNRDGGSAGHGLAFFVSATLVDGFTSKALAPVYWDRNAVGIMLVGESVTLTAVYDGTALSSDPNVTITVINDFATSEIERS